MSARILVMDDEKSNRMATCRVLKNAGHEIFQAGSMEECLRLARKHNPDLLLLAVNSPDSSSMDICQQIKTEEGLKDIFIVTLSSISANTESQAEETETGADGRIACPISNYELLAQVAVMLRIKTAEYSLKVSEKRFSVLMENSTDAISLLDIKGRVVYDNPAAPGILGYGREEWLGKNIFKLIHPDDLEKVKAQFRNLTLTPGTRVQSVFRLRHKNRSWLWMDAVATNLLNESGVNAIVVNYRDITERVQTDTSLRESEQKYRSLYVMAERREQERALLDSVRTALAHELDLTTILRTVVEAIAKTFGYTLVSLYLLHDETLVLQHQIGYSNVIKEIPVTQGVTGRVIRSGIPLLIEDVHAERNFLGAIDNIVSEVCVPLFYEDQIIGVLNVESTQNTKLSEADLNLMIALSEHISPAIGRARLYTEIGKNEKRFRALIENSADAITLLDAQGLVTYDSPSAPGMLGYAPEERIGKSIFELIHADDLSKTQELLQKLIEKTVSRVHNIFRLRHKNKSWIWVEAVATNLLDEPGVNAIVVNYRDITERVQAEKALQESEANQRLILDNVEEVIYSTRQITPNSPVGVIQFVNNRTEQALGYSPHEFMENHDLWYSLIHPDDIPSIQEQTAIIFETKLPGLREYRLRHKQSGTYHRFEDHVVPHRDEAGNIIGTFGVARDITERTRAERRSQTLLEASPDCVLVVDTEGKIIIANRQSTAMFGYSPNELIGKPVEMLIPERFRQKHSNHQEKYFGAPHSRQMGMGLELFARRRDGSEFPVDISLNTLEIEEGTATMTVVRDMTERKKIETALLQSEQAHRTLFENVPVGLYRTTADGRILDANPALVNIFGYQDRASLMKVNAKDLYVNPATDRTFVNEIGENDSITNLEMRFRRRDGTIFYAEDNIHVIRDEHGGVLFFEGSLIDINKRKQAEEQLRETQTFMTTLLELAPTSIYILSLDHRFRLVNRKWEQDTQVARADAVGRSFEEIYPTEQARKFEQQNQQVAQTGSMLTLEEWVETPNGARCYYTLKFPLRNASGLVEAIGGLSLDITDRKQAEEKLQKSEKRYEDLIRVSPVGIFRTDENGLTTYVNRKWRELSGMSFDEALGNGWLHAVHPEDREKLIKSWEESAQHIQPSFADYRFLRPDGKIIWVMGQATPERNSENQVIGYVGTITDITERKRAEEIAHESEVRYRSLFEDSPISLWEEDFSALKIRLESLRDEGIKDFKAYFASHPQMVLECMSLVKIVDVNKATLKLFGAKAKADFLQNLTQVIGNDSDQLFQNELISIAQGKSHFNWEGVNRTLDGRQIVVRLNLSVIPGYEDTFSKVIISMVDITERKQTEDLMRASEKRYHDLFEDSPISLREEDFSPVKQWLDTLRKVGVTDFHTYLTLHPEVVVECATMVKIRDVNKAAMKMYGVESKNNMPNTLAEILGGKNYEHFKDQLANIADGQIEFNWEGIDQTIDGRQVYVEVKWSVAAGHENDLSKVIVSLQDITERKQAEKALQQSEERLRQIIDLVPYFIFAKDIDGRFILVNQAVADAYGTTVNNLTGKSESDFAGSEEEVRQFRSKDLEVINSGKQISVPEETITDAMGNVRILSTIKIPFTFSDTSLPAVLGVSVDITESKQAGKALHDSEERFKNAFQYSAIGMSLVSLEGKWLRVNSTLCSILGYSEDELLTKTFQDITHPDDLNADLNYMNRVLAGEIQSYTMEKRYFHKEGKIVWVLLVVALARDNSGTPLYFISQIKDITENKLAEENLHQRLAELEVLYQSGLTISQILRPREIAQKMINLLDQNMGWHHAAIRIYHPEDETLELIAFHQTHAENDGELVNLEERFNKAVSHASQGLSGWAVQHSQSVRTGDLKNDSRYAETFPGLQSGLYMPIKIGERTLGVISIESEKENAFTESDERLTATLAAQAASALENARLFEESRLHTQELEQRVDERTRQVQQTYLILEETSTYNQKILDNSPIGIAAYHSTGECAFANIALEKMLNAPTGKLLEQNFRQNPKWQETGMLASAEAALQTGLQQQLEVHAISTFGKEVWLDFSFVSFENNQETHLLLLAEDISERKRAEQRLIELSAEIEDLYNNAPCGYHSIDAEQRIALMNNTLLKWLGYQRSELIGKSFDELVTPASLPIFYENFQNLQQHQDIYDQEMELICKDGRVLPVSLNASAMFDDNGNFVRTRASTFDISYRRVIEQSLRESESYARLLFNAAPDPVSVSEPGGLVLDVNTVFEQQHGVSREEVRGRNLGDLGIFPEEEAGKAGKYIMGIVNGEKTVPIELKYYAPDDKSERTLELHSYPITVKGKDLILSTSRDITTHKQAEETLRLANTEMEHALRLKNEFLANMSHELRTPLNAILGISESLEEQIAGTLNEKQLKYIRIVKESGRHLLDLINDILDLSKIEAGRMELDIRKVSVEMLCQSSLRMVKELAQKKSLNVSFKVKGDVKVILADERRLKQSLVNLFSNAVKFTPNGKEIGLEVSGHPESNEVTFTVWDQGVGIAEENIKRLFKPFVQLDAGLSREFQGTGLGLALVAQMINLHGGHVKIESELGKGSRFIITLPWPQSLQTPHAKVTAKLVLPSSGSDEKRIGTPRILLVEDTEVVIQLVNEYLKYKGYEVINARNGMEAVQLATQEHPDLILMDVMMPVMDGMEATIQIRKDKTLQTVPIIALTALAMAGDEQRCLDAGMNDYMSKPIQMSALSDMIEKHLKPDREK